MTEVGPEEIRLTNAWDDAWNENALHPIVPLDDVETFGNGMSMIGPAYEPPRVLARRQERERILAERQREQSTNPDQPTLT